MSEIALWDFLECSGEARLYYGIGVGVIWLSKRAVC